jgi:hypothetical protein
MKLLMDFDPSLLEQARIIADSENSSVNALIEAGLMRVVASKVRRSRKGPYRRLSGPKRQLRVDLIAEKRRLDRSWQKA